MYYQKILLKIISLLILVVLFSACATKRSPYKRNKRRNDCNCSSWSYNKSILSDSLKLTNERL